MAHIGGFCLMSATCLRGGAQLCDWTIRKFDTPAIEMQVHIFSARFVDCFIQKKIQLKGEFLITEFQVLMLQLNKQNDN